MLIIAHHHISDPEGFWSAAENVANNLPGSLKIISVFPSQDAKTGTCLWEGENVQEVQEFLDKSAGQFAQNVCYEVNVEKAIGLPSVKLAEASLS
jgi:hypothetical protein